MNGSLPSKRRPGTIQLLGFGSVRVPFGSKATGRHPSERASESRLQDVFDLGSINVSYALRLNNTTPSEQFLAILLAHHCNDKTRQCFPSLSKLAQETHFTRRTIINLLRSMVRKQILAITKARTRKGFVNNNYRLNFLPHPSETDGAQGGETDNDTEKKPFEKNIQPTCTGTLTSGGSTEPQGYVSKKPEQKKANSPWDHPDYWKDPATGKAWKPCY